MADKDHTPKATANTATSAAPDDQLGLKKRARRRLVGAIALALLAVIILPMVMDQEPKPATQDIQIRIPSQEPGANSVVSRITPKQPTPTPLPAESKTSQLPVATAVAPEAKAETAPAAKTETAPAPQSKPEAKAEPKVTAKPESKPEAKAEAKPEPKKPEAKAAAKADPARKPDSKAEVKPPAKVAEKAAAKNAESARAAALLNDQHWIVQLGSYQDPANVKTLQAKLKELGYSSFTEKVETAQGSRIRVRCGPFASREAAEKAQSRLKRIGAGGPTGGSVAQAQ